MKKVLLASTAVAAFVAFSGTAQAQDPGMADFGATEGGGKAGSAFTVSTSGAVKFYLKYATGDESLNDGKGSNSGLFTLINSELEINGAATTDNGTDISTHVDFNFSGNSADDSSVSGTANIGGQEQQINLSNFAVIDELSMKIAGGWGSVEMGGNDGAEDSLKTYGGSIAAGTGGVDGDYHSVSGGPSYVSVGGTAGSGDSGDSLKVTYLSPKVAGFQTGISLNYVTESANDINGGTFGVGVGAKYAGSAGGFDYALSVVWGDRAILGDTSGAGVATRTLVADAAAASEEARRLAEISVYETAHDRVVDAGGTLVAGNEAGLLALVTEKEDIDALVTAVAEAAPTAEAIDAAHSSGGARGAFDAHYGGLGIGVKLGGAGVSAVGAVTIDGLGRNKDYYGDLSEGFDLNASGGVAYAIPGGKSNVSVTAAVALPYGVSDAKDAKDPANYLNAYLVVASADYAVLPGVTLAVDLGYGDSDIDNEDTKSGGFTGLLRVKAAF